MLKVFGLGLMVVSSTLLMACNPGVKFTLPSTSNNFDQNISYNNKVDILWIMDNSESMQKHQQNLSAQIPALVSKLNSLKMDYQMAVITTSMGGTVANGGQFIGSPRIMTNSTADLSSQLASRLVVGENGSNLERGLYSMETVLSPTYLANDGKGFLRYDALLVVIALSNEDDQSRTPAADDATYYTNFLDSVKAPWADGTRSWTFNFLGILTDSGACATTGTDYKAPGYAFMSLADASNGTKASICSADLSVAVSGISARVMQILTDFKLSSVPNLSTIVVKINGQVIPQDATNGWQYIPDKNVIRFNGTAVPAADASIVVNFTPASAS